MRVAGAGAAEEGRSAAPSASERHRRRLYRVICAAGVALLVLSWVLAHPVDAFMAVGYPAAAVYLVVLLVLLGRDTPSLRAIELALLGGMGVLVMARLAWHYLDPDPFAERVLTLAGGHYWALGLLIVAGFVMLDRRAAVALGAGVWGLASVLAVAGLAPRVLTGVLDSDLVFVIARVHLFLALMILLVLLGASLRDELAVAVARSQAFEQAANTDVLTGAANRRAAQAELAGLQQTAQRTGRPAALIVADLDHFKQVNDVHGHSVGDRVLAQFVALTRQQVREFDVVARFGGEEFVILTPDTDAEQASHLAERIRAALADTRIAGLAVTASFGVTELRSGETLDATLARADQRLYEAKRGGRNQVVAG